MATRLYPQSTTPALTPARDAAWTERATGATPAYRDMVASGMAAYTFESLSQTESSASAVTGLNLHVLTLVSPSLSGSGTLSGTFAALARAWESEANANAYSQAVVKLVDSTGGNVRVLYAGGTGSSAEFAASAIPDIAAHRLFPSGTEAVALTSQAFSAGDRIVVELGARLANTRTNNYLAGVWLGHAVGGTDIPFYTPGATTQDNPWVEFSQDLTFGSGPAEILGAGASVAPLAVSAGAGTVADPAALTTYDPATVYYPVSTYAPSGASAITGAGASVGVLPVSAGAGAVAIVGAGASVGLTPISAGSAGVLIAGAGASTAPTASSTGTAQAIAGGTGSSTLPAGVSVGTAVAPIAGAGASSLPLPASAGAGLVSEFLPEITGTGSSAAPLPESGGSAVAIVGGTGASTLALAASAGAGSVSIGGAGATTITLPLSSGTGRVLIAGAGASHIPLSGSGGRLRVFGGGITPASRGYVVPAEDRGYVVPFEDRGYTVPSD